MTLGTVGGRVSLMVAMEPSNGQVWLGISQGCDVTDSPRCSTCIGTGRAGEESSESVFAEKEIIDPMEWINAGISLSSSTSLTSHYKHNT